jgi:hypothetical protein
MNNIQLHVGYIGITRKGKRVEITHRDNDPVYVWACEKFSYSDKGHYCLMTPTTQDIVGPWVETPVEPQVNYNDGKWHRWGGATECPVHNKSTVEYVWHDEIGRSGVLNRVSGWDGSDTRIKWSQVVKFRVTKEYVAPVEPREFWIQSVGHGLADVKTEKPSDMYGHIHVREVI